MTSINPEILIPPGPSGFGKLVDIHRYNQDRFQWFEDKRRLGPIVRTEFMGMTSYTLFDLEMIEHVMVKNSRNYMKDIFVRSWSGVMGNGLLTSDGDLWKKQRQMIQPAFRRERIDHYGRVMIDRIEAALGGWESGQTRIINHDMMELTLDIVATVLFGANFSKKTQAEFGAAFVDCTAYYESMLEPINFALRNLPLPRRLRYQRALEKLNAIVSPLLAERRLKADENSDLLSILINARDENGERMSDQQARDEAMTLFMAGHETSSIVMTMTLFLISQHPEIQAKVQEEIDAVCGQRRMTTMDVPQLKFMRQVVHEAMRLYPPVWLIGRTAIEDDVVRNYRIKRGSTVVVPVRTIHRIEKFYPAPNAFRPERWTPEFEKELPRAAFIPFGYGQRACMGGSFAMMEIQLALGMILQKFRLTLESEKEPELQPSITARPRNAIRIGIKNR
jgi:cytochrome P450